MANAAQLAAKCHRMATTIPRAQKAASEQTARAVKPLWLSEARLNAGSTIAGRKVAIRDSTAGMANVTTLVRWVGPVHLVEGPTRAHFMTARRVATRAGARRRQALVGATAAFGGTNRGAFGALRGAAKNGNAKRALTIGPNLRAYAFHPGTTGRGFWQRNKATARTVATTVYKQAAMPAMLREAGFA